MSPQKRQLRTRSVPWILRYIILPGFFLKFDLLELNSQESSDLLINIHNCLFVLSLLSVYISKMIVPCFIFWIY